MKDTSIAILGAGNLGTAIAEGLLESEYCKPKHLTLTRRHPEALEVFSKKGIRVETDNVAAVKSSDVLLICVEPQQLDALMEDIVLELDASRHILVSAVSGVDLAALRKLAGPDIPIARAMPNTAISVRESMTCLSFDGVDEKAAKAVTTLFDALGRTRVIPEENMIAATALGACGVAFFLRAIRAASQGGIEIGFHADEALSIAAQTAKGAAALLLAKEKHPEREIDRVTTPRGCTIAGLNRMEHEGFSSAMIKGITLSAEKAAGLYPKKDG